MKALLSLEDLSRGPMGDILYRSHGPEGDFIGSADLRKQHLPWVALVKDFDPQYNFVREFLKGQLDYSEANSKNTRYVYQRFLLSSGKIYDVHNPAARRADKYPRRFFCTVTRDGEIAVISEDEARQTLRVRDYIRG